MKERRTFEIRSTQIDEDFDRDKYVGIVEGYALKFNNPASYYYTEIIDRNALNKTDMKDTVLRYNHSEDSFSVARTRNRSMELTVDEIGLKVRAKIINTQYGRDLYRMIQEGLVDQMSFAFTVAENGDSWDNETKTRRILDIEKLYDVSAVDQPFYEDTVIVARSLKSFEDEYEEKRKLELEKEKMLFELELLK